MGTRIVSLLPRQRRRTVIATLFVALLTLAAAPLFAGSARAASAPRDAIDNEFVRLVNAARTANGLPPLTAAPGLRNLSVYWSGQLADGTTSCNLQHNPNAWNQLPSYGAANRTAWAENVAVWSTDKFTTQQIFDNYMNSAGHRANILGANYRYIGVGTVSATTGACIGRDYNTMTFTDKVDTPPATSTPQPGTTTAPTSATTTTAPTTTGTPPAATSNGTLESVVLSGTRLLVKGWAADPARPTTPIDVRLTAAGPTGTRTYRIAAAAGSRPDVAGAYPAYGPYHGFYVGITATGKGSHQVCAYAMIGTDASRYPALGCRTVTVN